MASTTYLKIFNRFAVDGIKTFNVAVISIIWFVIVNKTANDLSICPTHECIVHAKLLQSTSLREDAPYFGRCSTWIAVYAPRKHMHLVYAQIYACQGCATYSNRKLIL